MGIAEKSLRTSPQILGMPARFYENEVVSKLKHKRKLSAFLDELANKHLKKLKKIQLTYIFCDDNYLLQINKDFLNHKTLTDIITFDMSESDHELIGEIYISVDRVAENAEKFEVSYNEELHRVIFHGALHLCGYGDKTEEEKKKMRHKENHCLKHYLKD